MDFLPVFLNLKNQNCLVIGGNEDAYTKVSLLLRAGGKVKVISSSKCSGIIELEKRGEIVCYQGPFSENDLESCRVVIVAIEDDLLRREVSRLAQNKNIPVNVVDHPDLCSFTMPSIVDRSPLLIAVSTGGTSPTLARIIRSRLEAMLPQSYGRLANLISGFREKAKLLDLSRREKHNFWNRIFSSPIIEMFLSGKEKEARDVLKKEFEGGLKNEVVTGEVCLVGAGPGDPDLLTLRALRLIQNADTIVYDRLVFPTLLDYARRDAELIYVGKKSANHIVPQDQINQILVDLAKQGKMVVRLKGGDPFIFGRGGEEIEMLMSKGVSFQVIPGVTAASGCSAYAGIPLTHRDYAQACVFVTGHLKKGGMDLNWGNLVQPQQTVVFYMGVANIEVVCRRLIEHGMSREMTAAVIQKGTTKNQKVYAGMLSELPRLVVRHQVKPPALLIIGEVVKLHQKFAGSNLDRIL